MDHIYHVKDISGKGKGLVATRKIPKGTRILSEEPVMQVPDSFKELPVEERRAHLLDEFNKLTEDQQQEFLNLHNNYPHKSLTQQYIGIIRTNGFYIKDGAIGGVFLKASRINHACDNNATMSWNENIKQHTAHAIRDINEGEEITIYYLKAHGRRRDRQEELRKKYGFSCSCRLCSLPAETSQKVDEILEEINRLALVISQLGLDRILSYPLRALRYLDREAQLYNMVRSGDPAFSRVYMDAAQVFIMHGDLARARIFAERAVQYWKISGGWDSPNVIKFGKLAQDPRQHELYGRSNLWTRAVGDLPTTLEPGGFEDWLWKRPKPARTWKPGDLRNHDVFPAFDDLPFKQAVDLALDLRPSMPQQHWCFLAEIVDFEFDSPRLHMKIRDVDGKTVPLLFFTEGRGSELDSADIQKGYTVAILYAGRHAHASGRLGIRHEDQSTLKIFPASLNTLFKLSDHIQQFSPASDRYRKCHGCGKSQIPLKKCSKCLFFAYCGKTCQIRAWREKGHNVSCKLLENLHLRAILTGLELNRRSSLGRSISFNALSFNSLWSNPPPV